MSALSKIYKPITNYFVKIFSKAIGYIRRYIKEEFQWSYFIFTILFMAVGIYAYYFTDLLVPIRQRNAWRSDLIYYFAGLYGFVFVVSYLAYAAFSKKTDFLKNGHFWFLVVFAVMVFSFRSVTHVYSQNLKSLFVGTEYPRYWLRLCYMVIRMLAVIIPIAFYWYVMDRKNRPLYGFTLKGYDTRPYLMMLALMVPLIVWASTQADFLSSYPRANRWGLEYFSLDRSADIKYYVLFEFIYGLDFVSIEFFFRGFLILAFMRIVGPGAILAMACFYCFIHFGKPMGETISSYWGGTLLGILAYYSGSIVGGIIVHMGIAWMMEFGGLIGNILKN